MMPPYSWFVPGRKPGTSTNVTSGRLKQSQNRTKRAALIDASMSRQPARCAGWFVGRPRRRILAVVARQERQHVADARDARQLVGLGEVRHAGPRRVGVR